MVAALIKAVVFDFDGTLVLSNQIKYDAFQQTAEAHGLDPERVMALRHTHPGANRHEIFAELSRQLRAEGFEHIPDGPRFVTTYADIVTREVTRCDWVPGAEATLDRLAARGLALFINSATPGDGLLPIVEKRGMHTRFQAVLGGPDSKIDNLNRIARQTALEPAAMVMIGDGEDDRIAAASFGCHFIGVELETEDHGRPAHRLTVRPAHLVPDLSGVPQLIDAIAADRSTP
ncbi:phosphatase [Salinisphaera hydrothermalis C27AD]